MTIDVATIQTGSTYTKRVIAPVLRQEDGSALMDSAPAYTDAVHTFTSVKEAAGFMQCSESTVRRQLKEIAE